VTPHVWEPVGASATPVDLYGEYPRSVEVLCRRCGTRILATHVASVDRIAGWNDCDEQLAYSVMET